MEGGSPRQNQPGSPGGRSQKSQRPSQQGSPRQNAPGSPGARSQRSQSPKRPSSPAMEAKNMKDMQALFAEDSDSQQNPNATQVQNTVDASAMGFESQAAMGMMGNGSSSSSSSSSAAAGTQAIFNEDPDKEAEVPETVLPPKVETYRDNEDMFDLGFQLDGMGNVVGDKEEIKEGRMGVNHLASGSLAKPDMMKKKGGAAEGADPDGMDVDMDELFGDAPADGKVPMVELEELFADDEDMFAGIEAQDLADGEAYEDYQLLAEDMVTLRSRTAPANEVVIFRMPNTMSLPDDTTFESSQPFKGHNSIEKSLAFTERENSRGQKLVKLTAPENTMRWRFAVDRNNEPIMEAARDMVDGSVKKDPATGERQDMFKVESNTRFLEFQSEDGTTTEKFLVIGQTWFRVYSKSEDFPINPTMVSKEVSDQFNGKPRGPRTHLFHKTTNSAENDHLFVYSGPLKDSMRATPLEIETATHRMLKDAQLSRTRLGPSILAITAEQRESKLNRYKSELDQGDMTKAAARRELKRATAAGLGDTALKRSPRGRKKKDPNVRENAFLEGTAALMAGATTTNTRYMGRGLAGDLDDVAGLPEEYQNAGMGMGNGSSSSSSSSSAAAGFGQKARATGTLNPNVGRSGTPAQFGGDKRTRFAMDQDVAEDNEYDETNLSALKKKKY